MSTPKSFHIKIAGPVPYETIFETTPDDLTTFEYGIHLFCYEYNRLVEIDVGEMGFGQELGCDITFIILELPALLNDLTAGKEIELCLPDDNVFIKLKPIGEKVIAAVNEDFASSIELDKPQVIEELKGFVESVMALAVEGNYVTAEQAVVFLAGGYPD